MAEHDELEGEVLSREEMKSTKGGAGAASEAAEAGLKKRDESLLADTSVGLETEALNAIPQDESALRRAPRKR